MQEGQRRLWRVCFVWQPGFTYSLLSERKADMEEYLLLCDRPEFFFVFIFIMSYLVGVLLTLEEKWGLL